eukprot:602292-Amphidinium_carterae.1
MYEGRMRIPHPVPYPGDASLFVRLRKDCPDFQKTLNLHLRVLANALANCAKPAPSIHMVHACVPLLLESPQRCNTCILGSACAFSSQNVKSNN